MKKQFKYFKQILIPCMSAATAIGFIVPIACVFSKKHVTMDYESQRWATIKIKNQNWFEYHFKFTKPLAENQTLEISTEECFSSEKRANCWAKLHESYEKISDSEINIKMYLERKDGSEQLTQLDTAFFNIKFSLKNEKQKNLWSDEIRSLRLRYEPKE